jgi:pimeloyl-ACP methyl ester carboxylesterase
MSDKKQSGGNPSHYYSEVTESGTPLKKIIIRKPALFSGRTARTAGFFMVIFLLAFMVKVPSVSADLRRPANLDFSGTSSDSKETVIEQVFEQTAINLGLDQIHLSRDTNSDAGVIDLYPEFHGPIEGGLFKGIHYSLQVPVNDRGSVYHGGALLIHASPDASSAEQDMTTIRSVISQNSGAGELISFHGFPAVIYSEGDVEWQAGRFRFVASNCSGLINVDPMVIAEAFYASAVNYGLIDGQGNTTAPPDAEEEEQETAAVEPGLTVKAQPSSFREEGDTVMLMVSLTGNDGLPAADQAVSLYDTDSSANLDGGETDQAGKITFTVEHNVPGKEVYTYRIKAMELSKTIAIPVSTVEIIPEICDTTGEPYRGLVIDGKSVLAINVSLTGEGSGRLTAGTPRYGTLEGDSISDSGAITLQDGKAVITYLPPAYLDAGQFTHRDEDLPGMAAGEEIDFVYTGEDGGSSNIILNLYLYRPPVILVHGFTGDKTTWTSLANFLAGGHYDTHTGEYYILDQSIQAQARMLKENIKGKKEEYERHNIRISSVDIVGHSMGGLISRYYTNSASYYGNDVRKLIMVGTPNHGCSWNDLQLGRVQSYLGDSHQIAAEQLYSRGDFITTLNRGENRGTHLNREVEYGNIYSYSALPGFFSGDIVVPAASAYLTGVETTRLFDHTHSSTFSSAGTPVTESSEVFQQIEEWLNRPLLRQPLTSMRAAVSKAKGEVYLRQVDPKSGEQLEPTLIDAASGGAVNLAVEPFDAVITADGRTMLTLYLNETPWGYIHLHRDTELILRYISPRLTEVKVQKGSARFTSFSLDEKGHFAVEIAVASGKWQNVTGLDTDFVIYADEKPVILSLEGSLLYQVEMAESKIGSVTLNTGESCTLSGADEITAVNTDLEQWWKNNFYNDQTATAKQGLLNNIFSQAENLVGLVSSGSWRTIALHDLKDNYLALGALALIIIFFISLLAIFRRRRTAR